MNLDDDTPIEFPKQLTLLTLDDCTKLLELIERYNTVCDRWASDEQDDFAKWLRETRMLLRHNTGIEPFIVEGETV